MRIVQNTYPTGLVYPITQLKDELRVDEDSEIVVLTSMLKAATSIAEQYTNRVLLSSTFTAYLDELDSLTVEIFKFPITSIDSVKYYNTSGTLTTLTANTDYFVDTTSCPARVKFLSAPSLQSNILNGIQINFTAGHSDINSIDSGIIAAIRVMTGQLYEQRQNESNMSEASMNFDRLLNMYIKGSLWL